MLIPLDEALTAGRLKARTELPCLAGVSEGSDHRPVKSSLGSKVDLVDLRLTPSKLVRVLGLQAPEGGLSLGFTSLRRNLHEIAGTG